MPNRTPYRRPLIESLEARRLCAAINFGDAGAPIRFPAAAAVFPTATGAGQTVAVIDSGIDYNHPSLGGGFGAGRKVVGGYDFVDNDNDPMDTFGHGTEVSGIIAGSPAPDGSGNYQGIAPQAKLVALRIDDQGDVAVPDSRIELALQWVIQHRTQFGITVVNVSYGQGAYDGPTVSTVYGDEIQALHDAGVAIVSSSGNEFASLGAGINTPAADPNVISVGATDSDDAIAGTAQRGASLSILAPGEDVLTTLLDGGYGLIGGTSFSSPIVAGAVALMRNVDSTLRPDDALSILRASGVAKFDGGPKSGPFTRRYYPRLDLLNALTLTQSRKPATASQQAALGKYGNQNGMAVDAEGVTHFVYYDASAQTMKYATRSAAGVWSNTRNVDNSLPFQGYYLSIALDTLGQPAIAYFDGLNGDLKYARLDGTAWQITSVDVKNSTGAYPSLVFDRNGNAVITYYRKTTGDLRAAQRSPAGTWTLTNIATAGDVGRYTAAAVNSSGRIGVAYEDSTHGWLGYSQFDPRTNAWANTIIDQSTRGIAYVSLAFSTGDAAPWVSYYDASPANLKVARFVSRRWRTQTIASRGATGLFSTLFFADADQANVLYYDKRADALYLAEEDDGVWSAERLQARAGRFAAGVVDPTRGVFRYTFYSVTAGKYVRFGERFI